MNKAFYVLIGLIVLTHLVCANDDLIVMKPPHDRHNKTDEEEEHRISYDKAEVRYYFTCYRGFVDGFNKGLYSNNTEGVSKKCLDEEAVEDVFELDQIIMD